MKNSLPSPQSTEKSQGLKAAWDQLKVAEPGLRIREAAEKLGVSELELLITGVGEDVSWLRPEPQAILQALEPLGELMGLTRNDHAVIERKGIYQNFTFFDAHHMGQAVNPDIDLRLFMRHWKYCLAVAVMARGKVRNSIQFFDGAGTALHKVYTLPESDEQAYQALLDQFRSESQPTELGLPPAADYKPQNGQPEPEALRRDWEALQDTHDFVHLLRKHKTHRLEANHLVGSDLAFPLAAGSLDVLLERAAENQTPIMVFVGNHGIIQIHTGPIRKVARMGIWENVLDPKFNLHVNTEAISEAWVVRKPTVDGIVTSVEFYDHDGAIVLQCFGKRKPGLPELPEWRSLIDALPLISIPS